MNDKICEPREFMAEAYTTVPEAKKLCSMDSSCNHFVKSGRTGKFFKCIGAYTIQKSLKGATIYMKGKVRSIHQFNRNYVLLFYFRI